MKYWKILATTVMRVESVLQNDSYRLHKFHHIPISIATMKSNSYCFYLCKQTSMDIGSKGAEGTLMHVFCYSYFHEVFVYLRQIQVWEIIT